MVSVQGKRIKHGYQNAEGQWEGDVSSPSFPLLTDTAMRIWKRSCAGPAFQEMGNGGKQGHRKAPVPRPPRQRCPHRLPTAPALRRGPSPAAGRSLCHIWLWASKVLIAFLFCFFGAYAQEEPFQAEVTLVSIL